MEIKGHTSGGVVTTLTNKYGLSPNTKTFTGDITIPVTVWDHETTLTTDVEIKKFSNAMASDEFVITHLDKTFVFKIEDLVRHGMNFATQPVAETTAKTVGRSAR